MKDFKFTDCRFSIDIVPYMYGELSSSDRSVFESHLLDCAVCTDEFAEISNARYEVYDWKKLAFDPLPTPVFEVPREVEQETAGVSWIDRLRAAFSQGWAVPTVAFASIAVFAGLTGLFLVSSDTDVAGVNRAIVPAAPPVTVDSPAPVTVSEPDNKSETTAISVGTGDRKPAVRKAETVVHRAEPKRVIRTARPVPERTIDTRATRIETPRVPRLNDFDEDEDTSLRLAQLFEDIETSD